MDPDALPDAAAIHPPSPVRPETTNTANMAASVPNEAIHSEPAVSFTSEAKGTLPPNGRSASQVLASISIPGLDEAMMDAPALSGSSDNPSSQTNPQPTQPALPAPPVAPKSSNTLFDSLLERLSQPIQQLNQSTNSNTSTEDGEVKEEPPSKINTPGSGSQAIATADSFLSLLQEEFAENEIETKIQKEQTLKKIEEYNKIELSWRERREAARKANIPVPVELPDQREMFLVVRETLPVRPQDQATEFDILWEAEQRQRREARKKEEQMGAFKKLDQDCAKGANAVPVLNPNDQPWSRRIKRKFADEVGDNDWRQRRDDFQSKSQWATGGLLESIGSAKENEDVMDIDGGAGASVAIKQEPVSEDGGLGSDDPYARRASIKWEQYPPGTTVVRPAIELSAIEEFKAQRRAQREAIRNEDKEDFNMSRDVAVLKAPLRPAPASVQQRPIPPPVQKVSPRNHYQQGKPIHKTAATQRLIESQIRNVNNYRLQQVNQQQHQQAQQPVPPPITPNPYPSPPGSYPVSPATQAYSSVAYAYPSTGSMMYGMPQVGYTFVAPMGGQVVGYAPYQFGQVNGNPYNGAQLMFSPNQMSQAYAQQQQALYQNQAQQGHQQDAHQYQQQPVVHPVASQSVAPQPVVQSQSVATQQQPVQQQQQKSRVAQAPAQVPARSNVGSNASSPVENSTSQSIIDTENAERKVAPLVFTRHFSSVKARSLKVRLDFSGVAHCTIVGQAPGLKSQSLINPDDPSEGPKLFECRRVEGPSAKAQVMPRRDSIKREGRYFHKMRGSPLKKEVLPPRGPYYGGQSGRLPVQNPQPPPGAPKGPAVPTVRGLGQQHGVGYGGGNGHGGRLNSYELGVQRGIEIAKKELEREMREKERRDRERRFGGPVVIRGRPPLK